MAQSLGEVAILGYLKSFPEELFFAWSKGTGFAAIFGTILYFLRNQGGASF